MNMQMLMQAMTANNPVVRQVLNMKAQGMTPQQAMQAMAKQNPQIAQIMNGNPQQIAMNMLREGGIDPQAFMQQAGNLMK